MSEKALRIILIGVVVVVAAWAASALLGGRGGHGRGPSSALQKTLTALHEPDVNAVRVVNGKDTVELTRSSGRWLVDGWPSDSDAVTSFWTAVDSARVTELASSNPAHQEDLGVKGAGAIEVTFRKGAGDSVRVLLGRAGPYYPSSYARLPGHDDAWILSGDLRREASRPVEEWRDRTVVRVDTGAVHTILVARADTTVTFARKDSAWTADGRPASPKTVRSLLGGLADVQASGFAPDSVHPGTPERSVVALGAGRDTLAALHFVARKPSGFWVTLRGDSVIYRLPAYRVDAVTPTHALAPSKR
jgi:hypothetical protein